MIKHRNDTVLTFTKDEYDFIIHIFKSGHFDYQTDCPNSYKSDNIYDISDVKKNELYNVVLETPYRDCEYLLISESEIKQRFGISDISNLINSSESFNDDMYITTSNESDELYTKVCYNPPKNDYYIVKVYSDNNINEYEYKVAYWNDNNFDVENVIAWKLLQKTDIEIPF